MSTHELWICAPEAMVEGPQCISFEELRVADYLKAYTATGRPPVPPPALPANAAARAALHLPPLFAPTSRLKENDDEDLQLYEPTRNGEEIFQSIVAHEKWKQWSFEELRLNAYVKGVKTLPPGYVIPPAVTGATVPPPIKAGLGPSLGISTGGEQLQSISSQADKQDHSLEEHRVAYLFAKRDLTSAEITAMQANNPLVAPRPPAAAPAPPSLGLFSSPGASSSSSTSPWTPRPAAFRPF
ncbi:hypothetical protein CPB85DRAFT_667640 [Mucidula mucida]|nr:hypothetical protein CPB85DRAFT_667640 [Mucidula mucida]